jgi:hypothetical protein
MTDNEPKPTTYMQQAFFDAALGAQGRFGARERPIINGASPTVTVPGPLPDHLGGPQPGTEPPLGYSVEDQEPCEDFGGQADA